MASTEKRDGRIFGLGGLALLGAVAEWLWLRKHHPAAAAGVGSVGVVLGILGLFAPRAALAVRRLWMRVAHTIGLVNSTILLTLVFLVILTPIGLVRRLFQRGETPGWEKYETRPRDHFDHPY